MEEELHKKNQTLEGQAWSVPEEPSPIVRLKPLKRDGILRS